jgi:Tfp pilus assembly protein PilF
MTLLAETEARAGDYDAADRHFRQARAIAEGDSYLLAAYADFLLDRDRAREVVALLKDKGRNDGLLLRHAIALKRLGDPATQQIDDLRARFAAATLRGDASHQREQARFALQLLGDPGQALALAQRNWAEQKEPADARILLEAALALDDAGAARPVLAWLRQTNLEDRALETLAAQFEGRR